MKNKAPLFKFIEDMKTHLILLLTAAVLVVGCIDFEGDEPSPVNPDDTVIVNPIVESTL